MQHRKRSQCAQLINLTGFQWLERTKCIFFFFCHWLTRDCSRLFKTHKRTQKNQPKRFFNMYLLFILSHFCLKYNIWRAEVEAHKLQNIYICLKNILATTFVVFIACVNRQFQTWQRKVPSRECRAQTKTALSPGSSVAAKQEDSCRFSRWLGIPTGAQFKWTTMISKWLSVLILTRHSRHHPFTNAFSCTGPSPLICGALENRRDLIQKWNSMTSKEPGMNSTSDQSKVGVFAF